MSSLINIFFPDFSVPETIENQVAAPISSPRVKDSDALDARISATLDRGIERLLATDVRTS